MRNPASTPDAANLTATAAAARPTPKTGGRSRRVAPPHGTPTPAVADLTPTPAVADMASAPAVAGRTAGTAPDAIGAGAGLPAAPVLTREGHRLLTDRARRLRERTLPALRDELAESRGSERDHNVHTAHDRAAAGLRHLDWLLGRARIADQLPDDPDVVELGERVTLELDGERLTFVLVDPAEASLDDERISTDAPLARALLGRRVGEEFTVALPAGTSSCRVVATSRA